MHLLNRLANVIGFRECYVVEVHGGIVTWLLKRGLPWTGPAQALVLGHVVLGCDRICLEKNRRHERVHVRQYERWGPFFIPIYLVACLVIYLRHGDPYGDNPFEKEAFQKSDDRV